MAKITVEMLDQLVKYLSDNKQDHMILVKIDDKVYFSQIGNKIIVKEMLKGVTDQEPEILQMLKAIIAEDVIERIHAELVSMDAHKKGKIN